MNRKFIPQRKNANRHTPHGARLLEKSLQQDGWLDAQTAAADGEIISGSLRLEIAAEKFADVEPIVVESDGTRPVIIIRKDIPSADDPRARRLSVAANQIAHVDFNPDGELLKKWADEDEYIRRMFNDREWERMSFSPPPREVLPGELEDGEVGSDTSVFQLKNNVLFSSTTKYEIPDLLPDMCANVPEDIETYGGDGVDYSTDNFLIVYRNRSSPLIDKRKSFLCFYTYDDKFEDAFSNAGEFTEKLLAAKYAGVVAPNFSLWSNQPKVVKMYQVYKSRWCARYFQEVGIKVVPDVDWIDEDTFEYCLDGIPENLPCVSVQMQTGLKNINEHKNRKYGIMRVLETLRPEQFLVYGANPEWKRIVMDTIASLGIRTKPVFVRSITQISREAGYLKKQQKE